MSHYLWQLRPYLRQTAGQLVLGSLAGIAMNTAVVLPALFLGRAIDVAAQYAQGTTPLSTFAQAIALFVLATLATELPRVGKRWWLMTANARIRANLRADALRGVLAWPMTQLNATPIGDIMARVVGDVETLGVGVREVIIETWDTLLFLLSFLVAMLSFDAPLTLAALLPVPLAMLLAWASGRWIRQRTTAARKANSALTAGLQEFLAGIRAVRLLGMRRTAQTRIETLTDAQAQATLGAAQLRAILPALYTTLMTAGVLLVIWQGGQRVTSGTWTLGTFVAYLDLFLRFTGRGFRVPQLVNSVQAGGAAYARLQPLLAPAWPTTGQPRFASFRAGQLMRPPPTPTSVKSIAPHTPLSITLRDVVFAHGASTASSTPITPALNGISLHIPAGAFVAITGPVGSGKSALAKALLGLYPLRGGHITLNDDLPEHYIGQIGYLPQTPFLFSGTLRENIAMGRDCDVLDDAETERATHLAALQEDVAAFPAGLQTELGERGIRISGGQRQRVGLARAVASPSSHAPRLLVLDDPFSAVDVNTEAQIISALRAAFGDEAPPDQRATLVLCSHRLAAFPQADLIVVLDQGCIVEQGTHAALLTAGGMYARTYQAQAALARVATP